MSEDTPKSAPPRWLSPLTEYGPLVAFFVTYWQSDDLILATKVVVGTTVIAVAISFLALRKIPWMPLITAGVVAIFGGLTIWLADETFIKMKPTIVQVIFAAVLLGALAFGKLPLKLVMGRSMEMADAAWRTLTLRFAIFFLAMAALNEAVWRTQTTDFWVNFKVFGLIALTFVFIATQIPFMMRHGEQKDGQ